MLMAVDVGNTHTVLGLYKGETLICHWRVRTELTNTADELAATIHGLFALKHIDFNDISRMVLASVVPPIQSAWRNLAMDLFSFEPLEISSHLDTGLTIKTDNPAEVGADRIVNAVAAFDKYATPLIIVDFGTAITFDCVSAKGEYLGGIIAPGLSISLDALGQRTAKLPRVDITVTPARAIGTNTIDAIRSGVLFGYGGLVEELIARITGEMAPAKPKVIATGGMAALIAPHAPSIEVVEPMLTLEGLRLLHARNS
ncbi:MAG: type III pantothenate kinase [Desulfurivibrionaceae bacterium]|nr:type III pantothenate kinase [Desulfurivibrionaceae bacterium]